MRAGNICGRCSRRALLRFSSRTRCSLPCQQDSDPDGANIKHTHSHSDHARARARARAHTHTHTLTTRTLTPQSTHTTLHHHTHYTPSTSPTSYRCRAERNSLPHAAAATSGQSYVLPFSLAKHRTLLDSYAGSNGKYVRCQDCSALAAASFLRMA